MLTCGWFSPTGTVLGKESAKAHLVLLHRLPGKGRLRAVATVGRGCREQMSRSTPFQRDVELDWTIPKSVDL